MKKDNTIFAIQIIIIFILFIAQTILVFVALFTPPINILNIVAIICLVPLFITMIVLMVKLLYDIFKEEGQMKDKILIVDNMEINREVLIAILEDTYDIIETSYDENTMTKIKENISTLSLIILGITGEQTHAFETIELIQQQNLNVVPIVVFSCDDEHEKKSFKLGASDFIRKPFDPEIFKYRVNAAIKK